MSTANTPSPRRNALTPEHPEKRNEQKENVTYEADQAHSNQDGYDGISTGKEAPKPKPIGPPRPERPYPWVG
ncbi:MAG: hypothetical protein L6R38_002965 [Xanthoria sp. 2 TBL-2021]|nr:MAG: hypothetical protein L6R38_002965 [Xanthoria sp. 2 TBL-2021]